ncbi:zinc ribbon domain-containing protein [uncultured Sphingosinicella sp.]|uniref:zinc ribbon domain-containing protein n=1 Tax=uncultured Sphingosinicella sp. TaxID=478748 RepID=UPI0030DCA5D4|tara:strand:+ start:55848 stop:56555 length:708 start_codon:yes stop_codon:yes gene_type:complete
MAEIKKCPKCAEQIKLDALVCRFCGHTFDADDIEAAQKAFYRRKANRGLIKAAAILGVGFLLYKGCSSLPDTLDSGPPDMAYEAPEMATPYAAPATWSYSRYEDDVTGKEVQTAELRSRNYHNFEFPYEGNTYLTMTVRQHPRYGLDVIFRIDRGQLKCSSYDGCDGMISIDGKAERLTLNEPADSSSEYVFARYDAAILRKIKNAKTIVVELPTFRNGSPSWTFDSPGLVWPMP